MLSTETTLPERFQAPLALGVRCRAACAKTVSRHRASRSDVTLDAPKEKPKTADSWSYNEGQKAMNSFIDSALVAGTILGSFAAALMIQSAALRLLLLAMNRK